MKHALPAWTLALIVSAACAASLDEAPAPPRLPAGRLQALAEIARLEDQRTLGAGRLPAYLKHADTDVRARAATALGRIWWPEVGDAVTQPLLGALSDPQAAVRASAAFALGMRGDPVAGDALATLGVGPRDVDPHPLVRARAVEALSKLERPDLHPRVLAALADVDSGVRIEGAVGTHRWPTDAPDASAVNQTLVEHFDIERDRTVAEALLFALQRRAAPEALKLFLAFAESPRPIERLYAVRGLKALAPDPEVRKALATATLDRDWRVACEAVLGLGAFPARPTYAALDAAVDSLEPHVRRCAWESVTAQLIAATDPSDLELWAESLGEMEPLDDESAAARSAFVEARRVHAELTGAEQLKASAVLAALEADRAATEPSAAVDGEWVATARALGHGPGGAAAATVLDVLARHGSLRTAGAAIEALGRLDPVDARSKLHAFLKQRDLGLRLAAVLALGEMAAPEDLPHLEAAFRTSKGDIGPEVRFNALRVAARTGAPEAADLLRRGLGDERPFVRRVAREELARLGLEVPAQAPVAGRAGAIDDVSFPPHASNPTVWIATTRGTMTFELFPGEAPVHVHNFLTVAARGGYDGTLFHRVVPNFVIQGGDYRGDGNGGVTYRGEDSLRHEIGPRKYVRGSLGMPRNEDPDSGGSQIFVTHRATPHLDGRYTIFGELRDGFEVLDAIEVGDRILAVSLSVGTRAR